MGQMAPAVVEYYAPITEDSGSIKHHYYPSIAAIINEFPTPPFQVQVPLVPSALRTSIPIVQTFYNNNPVSPEMPALPTTPTTPTYTTTISSTSPSPVPSASTAATSTASAVEYATEGLRADLRVKTITIKALKVMLDLRKSYIDDFEIKVSALKKTEYTHNLQLSDLKKRCRVYLDKIAGLEEKLADKDEEIKKLKRMLKDGGGSGSSGVSIKAVFEKRRRSGGSLQSFVDRAAGSKIPKSESPAYMGSMFDD